MKLEITGDMAPEVAGKLLPACNFLEKVLASSFYEKSYGVGVDQIIIVIASVYDEPDLNADILVENEGYLRYRNYYTKKLVRVLNLSLFVSPSKLLQVANEIDIRNVVLDEICKKLESPNIELPEKFDYDQFVTDFKCEACRVKTLDT